MKKIFLINIILITIFASCSTELDVNAEWDEIPVIYCLLNQNDSVHYVRINKSFMGNEDAYVMAAESDSLYFNNIEVFLERWKNNSRIEIISLEITTEIVKDTGIFASDKNIIYKTNEQLFDDSEYKLVVNFPNPEDNVYATTELIKNFSVQDYFGRNDSIKKPLRVGDRSYIQPIVWLEGNFTRAYYITLYFQYFEIAPPDTTEYTISWSFPTIVDEEVYDAADNVIRDRMRVYISGDAFFQFIATSIPVKQDIKRLVGDIEIEFVLASDDFYTYIVTHKPSSGISQENQFFTNIENGVGIFSSRFNKPIKNIYLDDRSKDSLAMGRFTKMLKFPDRYGRWLY
ncbi:MAG: DUF4249 family protein [Bacteroidales bacterium]|nr:DUF4249 family protein [Bacteroidales bacterium]